MLSAIITSSIALLGLLCPVALAQQNSFINPPPPGEIHDYSGDQTFTAGVPVNIQWSTNYSSLTLVLWQNNNNAPQELLYDVPAIQEYTWNVDISGIFNLEAGEVFFFQLYRGNTSSRVHFSSHYFNITNAASTTTTTSSAPTSSATSTQTQSPASASMTATSTPSASTGLSSSAKVGIGVGVGVGVVCLLAGLGLGLFFRRRQTQQRAEPATETSQWNSPAGPPAGPPSTGWSQSQSPQEAGMYYEDASKMHQSSYLQRSQMNQPPGELDAREAAHELPDQQPQELPTITSRYK